MAYYDLTSRMHDMHCILFSAQNTCSRASACIGNDVCPISLQKVKEAVGLEKPMGKEGSQKGMEPAGVMENK